MLNLAIVLSTDNKNGIAPRQLLGHDFKNVLIIPKSMNLEKHAKNKVIYSISM